MHKKIFVFVIISLILLFVFVFSVFKKNSQNPISLSLSERAKEFISKEQSDGTGIWNEVHVLSEKSENQSENETLTQVITTCASFSLPFPTIRKSQEKHNTECVWKATTKDKMSNITFQIKKSPSLIEDSSFILRKRSNQYTEIPITQHDFIATSFYSNEHATLFIYKDQTLATLSISPPIESRENQQKFFELILSTFVILPKSE